MQARNQERGTSTPELHSSHGRPRIWFDTLGDESKEAVVLLHGFTGTRRTWDALSGLFAEDYFVILPDLPGHGRSGVKKAQNEMGIGATAEALAKVIRVAIGGRRKCALVGYSLGGRVALDLACRHQGLISHLVLEGASPGIARDDERRERKERDDALAGEIQRRGVNWFVDYWQDTPLFATQKGLPPSIFRAIRRDRLSNSALGLARSLRAAGTGTMMVAFS